MVSLSEQEVYMEQVVQRGGLIVMSSDEKRKYTVADIEALPEGKRAELFDGEMVTMGTPSTAHQLVLNWLNLEIYSQIKAKGGQCRVIPAPFAVYLLNDQWNYVEPDIVVVCNKDKLDKKGCHGAPDWVIEIVSPSSRKLDYYRKLEIYERAGVQEYWIVDPLKKQIGVYDLTQDGFPKMYSFADKVSVGIYKDFEIDFSQMDEFEF